MTPPSLCQFGSLGPPEGRCQSLATTRWGNVPFCAEHGDRQYIKPLTPNHHSAVPLPYGRMDQKGACVLSRLSADLPAEDKNLIKGICPKKGILNQLTQNIFHAIVTNLRANGITYYSPEHEQYLVDLILRGCTAIKSHQPAFVGYVNRGAPGTHAGTTGGVEQHGDAQEAHQSGESGEPTSEQSEDRKQGDVEQVSGDVNFHSIYH